MGKKYLISIMLLCILALMTCGTASADEYKHTLNAGTTVIDHDGANLTINNVLSQASFDPGTDVLVISGVSDMPVIINCSLNLKLDNVTIETDADHGSLVIGDVNLSDGVTVNLILANDSVNYFNHTASGAGIFVPYHGTLIIDTESGTVPGILYANGSDYHGGGDYGAGAGIGGSGSYLGHNSGDITINGGIIYAKAGAYGGSIYDISRDIGGAGSSEFYEAGSANITINGGTVSAMNYGIGGGSSVGNIGGSADVLITGGTVLVYSDYQDMLDIGSGRSGISGGTSKVQINGVSANVISFGQGIGGAVGTTSKVFYTKGSVLISDAGSYNTIITNSSDDPLYPLTFNITSTNDEPLGGVEIKHMGMPYAVTRDTDYSYLDSDSPALSKKGMATIWVDADIYTNTNITFSDDSGETFSAPGLPATVGSGSHPVVDVKRGVSTYNITLNANGGTFEGSGSTVVIEVGNDLDYNAIISFINTELTSQAPVNGGWTAKTWYKTTTSGVVSDKWESGVLSEGDILYVGWFGNITLDANGGEFGPAVFTKEFEVQQAQTFDSLTLPTVTFGSWDFNGWFHEVDSVSSEMTGVGLTDSDDKADDTDTFNVGDTIYAGWTGHAYFSPVPGAFESGTVLEADGITFKMTDIQPGENVSALVPAVSYSGFNLKGWVNDDLISWTSYFEDSGQTVSADWSRKTGGSGTGGATIVDPSNNSSGNSTNTSGTGNESGNMSAGNLSADNTSVNSSTGNTTDTQSGSGSGSSGSDVGSDESSGYEQEENTVPKFVFGFLIFLIVLIFAGVGWKYYRKNKM